MKVLITNKDLNFDEGANVEDVTLAYDVYDIYVGYVNGIRVAISREDGAIIVEDDDENT